MSVYKSILPSLLLMPVRMGVGAYGLFIVWVSLRPAGTAGAVPHLDKALHLLVYAILAVGISLGWPRLSKFRIFLGCVLFGASMEMGQALIGSGRTASLWDGVANSLGAALGIYLVILMERFFALKTN